MLHPRRFAYIDEIARAGSIRKAAARLNIASSAVNRQLLGLEEELGTPLFERLPRGLRLTAAGELLIEHIRSTAKDARRVENRIRALRSPQIGHARLTTTLGLASGALPAIVDSFLDHHPRTSVTVNAEVRNRIPAQVMAGDYDLGLGFNLPASAGLRTLLSVEVPLGLVVWPGHALANRTSVSMHEVVQLELALAEPGTTLREVIDGALPATEAAITPVMQSNSVETLRALVRLQGAVTILNPLDVFSDTQAGALTFVPITGSQVRSQPLKLVARGRSALETASSLFAEELAGALVELTRDLR